MFRAVRALLGMMVVVVFAGCNCGFEAVEECTSLTCPDGGDAQPDAGRFDAGATDAGRTDGGPLGDGGIGDAGFPDDGGVQDAGTAELDAGAPDAGAPDAGAPDAGEEWDGGWPDPSCRASLQAVMPRAMGHYVRVWGTASIYGAVDYVLGGYSAGVWGLDGIQRFTNAAYLRQGVPSGLSDTGVWMWTYGMNPVVEGFIYEGTNERRTVNQGPFVDFRISPGVSCPPGAGFGRFRFSTFNPPSAPNNLVQGDFEFDCPDAGISVQGCFHYDN